MEKAIGGYFELELKQGKNYIHSNLLALNSARNCLEFIITNKKYSKIYIPYFTCDVILEPLLKLNVEYSFYDVDNKLEPIFDYNILNNDEAILITNYFGIKSNYIKKISSQVRNIIVDNAQALFDLPIKDVDTFYSPRKFIGIPDGGFTTNNLNLNINFEQDLSLDRTEHLLKRIELGAEEGYNDFKKNDQSISNQPIKSISNLSLSIIKSVDFSEISKIRRENFNHLHKKLKNNNKVEFDLNENFVPMVYPYRVDNAEKIKKVLIENKIFCATYWPNVFDWCGKEKNSYHLTNEIISLPIDQRYNLDDMKKILEYV